MSDWPTAETLMQVCQSIHGEGEGENKGEGTATALSDSRGGLISPR
jgi:hypothetical protein